MLSGIRDQLAPGESKMKSPVAEAQKDYSVCATVFLALSMLDDHDQGSVSVSKGAWLTLSPIEGRGRFVNR